MQKIIKQFKLHFGRLQIVRTLLWLRVWTAKYNQLALKKMIGWLFIWKQEKSASRLVQEIFQLPDFSAKRLKSERPNSRKVAVFGPCDVCIDSLLRFLWIIFHPTTAYCRLKTSRPNSEWFEFVRLIAVTCFRRHTYTDGRFDSERFCSDLSPGASKP